MTGAKRSDERGRVEQRVLRALAAAVLCAVALVAALMSAAMVLYPGGTWFDREAPGHAFLSNFLCDLLAEQALNGQPNPIGSRLAWFGMTGLGIAMLPLWLLLPALMPDRPGLGRALRRVGTLGVSLLLVVPLATSERCGPYHGLVVELAGIPNFTALLLAVVGLARTRQRSRLVTYLGVALAATAFVDFAWYSWYTWRGELGTVFVPGLQKVAAILLLVWMAAVAEAVRRRA